MQFPGEKAGSLVQQQRSPLPEKEHEQVEDPLYSLSGEKDHGRRVEDHPQHADGQAAGTVQPVLHLAVEPVRKTA